MSCTLMTAIQSCDTCQRVLYFDSCHLTARTSLLIAHWQISLHLRRGRPCIQLCQLTLWYGSFHNQETFNRVMKKLICNTNTNINFCEIMLHSLALRTAKLWPIYKLIVWAWRNNSSCNFLFFLFLSIFVLSCLNREELDISKDDEGKFTSRFTVTLDITVDAEEVKSATHTWDTLKINKLFPQVCFSTKEEYLECQEEFGTCMIICYRCGSI